MFLFLYFNNCFACIRCSVCDRLNQLIAALNKLADPETVESTIGLLDLMIYVKDEEPAQ
jgi:hypothetical protein